MLDIEFVSFDQVDLDKLLAVVNEDSLRTHLIEHAYFDANSLKQWVADKIDTNKIPGCRIRAVYIAGKLAGWCGIQPDDKGYEIAIVLSQTFWGYGISVFKNLIHWAKELGHQSVVFHLLETRPEYKALTKMATKVEKTQLLGNGFTTYHIAVGD